MPKRNKISEKILIEDLIRVSRKLEKKHIPKREYNIHGAYSDSIIRKCFGSWNRALIIAGLRVYEGKNIPEKLLLINMENVQNKLGRLPVKRDMVRPLSVYSDSAYSNKFGSWSKSLRAFSDYLGKKEEYITALEKIELIELQNFLKCNPAKGKPAKIIKRQSRAVNYRMRYKVLKRDRFMCRSCGSSPADDKRVKLEIDHIIPWSKGGETVISNLQTLCRKCNLGKSNN